MDIDKSRFVNSNIPGYAVDTTTKLIVNTGTVDKMMYAERKKHIKEMADLEKKLHDQNEKINRIEELFNKFIEEKK